MILPHYIIEYCVNKLDDMNNRIITAESLHIDLDINLKELTNVIKVSLFKYCLALYRRAEARDDYLIMVNSFRSDFFCEFGCLRNLERKNKLISYYIKKNYIIYTEVVYLYLNVNFMQSGNTKLSLISANLVECNNFKFICDIGFKNFDLGKSLKRHSSYLEKGHVLYEYNWIFDNDLYFRFLSCLQENFNVISVDPNDPHSVVYKICYWEKDILQDTISNFFSNIIL